MTISLIAAMGRNMVIGNENKLIWHVPEDMKRFRGITRNKPVIMGRKTFESIGRPLPNRTSIIITRDKNYRADGCIVVHSVKESLNAAKGPEIMVIGGAQIYNEFMPIADRMYLTIIDEEFEGDAKFPDFDKSEWKEIHRENMESDKYKFAFVDFERISK